MPQILSCACGKKYKVDDSLAGRTVKCKACGRMMTVPAAVPAAEPEPSYDIADEPDRRPPPQETDAISRLAVNANTYASNPGCTKINFGKFISSYPAPIVMFAVLIIAGVIGGILKHPALFILSAAGLWVGAQHLIAARAKLRTGDVNPAVVVSDKPWLIAIYTDLGTGHAERPCIKIVAAPLAKMTGGAPAVGTRLAVASLYCGMSSDSAWKDFDPTVVACAVTDQADIDRVAASIPASEWRLLDEYLRRVPAIKPGLYRMW